jgi:hypothetical protein
MTSPTFHKPQDVLISNKAALDGRLDKTHFVLGHEDFAAFSAALDKAPELSKVELVLKTYLSNRDEQS